VGTFGRHLSDYRQINTLPPGTCFLASSLDPTTGKPLSDGFLRPYSGYTNIPMQYWDIPSPARNTKPVHAVFGNWQISGIAAFVSGSPQAISFTTLDGTDMNGGGDSQHVFLTGPATLPKDRRTSNRFFDTSVVHRPAAGTIGNRPREVFRGPGTNNWDLSLFRNIPIREKVKFQLRFEGYNAFNHTQFSGVNTAAKFDLLGSQVSQNFGQLSSAHSARVMQLAARISF
jgi:hypothetical protein